MIIIFVLNPQTIVCKNLALVAKNLRQPMLDSFFFLGTWLAALLAQINSRELLQSQHSLLLLLLRKNFVLKRLCKDWR